MYRDGRTADALPLSYANSSRMAGEKEQQLLPQSLGQGSLLPPLSPPRLSRRLSVYTHPACPVSQCQRLVQQWVITKVDTRTPDEEKDCNACQYDLDLDDTRWFHKQIYSYFN